MEYDNSPNRKFFGKYEYIDDCTDVADKFFSLSDADEKAAEILFVNGYYNQSVFMLIQSMEKYIKAYICQKINVTYQAFAEELRQVGHSLDNSVQLLIKIYSGNDENLRSSITYQIEHTVLKNVKFSRIYNAVRYPFYDRVHENYKFLNMKAQDYTDLHEIFMGLKNMLSDLNKI